jgi:hypothetical protein
LPSTQTCLRTITGAKGRMMPAAAAAAEPGPPPPAQHSAKADLFAERLPPHTVLYSASDLSKV